MVGRRLDLSKSIPKDSPFLKTLAEQLTLMEFSIYAAIQRRYTYCMHPFLNSYIQSKVASPLVAVPGEKARQGIPQLSSPEYQLLLGGVVC